VKRNTVEIFVKAMRTVLATPAWYTRSRSGKGRPLGACISDERGFRDWTVQTHLLSLNWSPKKHMHERGPPICRWMNGSETALVKRKVPCLLESWQSSASA
jgi:hypothetical protein